MTLAELRDQKNLTQREMAELLGVTAGAVGNWEAGVRIPRLPMLKRIADLFGVRIDDIEFPYSDDQAAARDSA